MKHLNKDDMLDLNWKVYAALANVETKPYLTKEERSTLRSLKYYENKKIARTDIVNVCVVLNTEEYEQNVLDHLSSYPILLSMIYSITTYTNKFHPQHYIGSRCELFTGRIKI